MPTRQAAYALRMGLAVAGSLFTAMWLRLENPYWAPTTILVVEGMNYGAVSDKLFKRLAGNITGALAGILVIALFSQTGPVYALACGALAMLGTYAMLEGRHPHFWRWALVAAGLITLFRVNTPIMAFYLGMDRVCAVTIGLIAATLSHQVIAPRYAGVDYRNHLDSLLQKLSELAFHRADQLIRADVSPLLLPGELIGAIPLLRDELHHACRDTEDIRIKRVAHEHILALLDDLSADLTLICIEPPSGPFEPTDRELAATRLRELAVRLGRLRASIDPAKKKPLPHSHIGSLPKEPHPSRGPWCGLITLALARTETLAKEARGLALGDKPAAIRRPANRQPKEEDLLGGPLHSALKALLAGAAMTLGMMLWRVTGWPGGSAVPLLATLLVIYGTASPAITLSFLAVILVISLSLSALLLFFVLPAIHSTALFFMVIVALFTFWGWAMHSPAPRLRGLGMLVGVLMNSCAYSYTATSASFAIVAGYAWCMVGGTLIAGLLLGLFYPSSPGHRFAAHASGFFTQTRLALTATTPDHALACLGFARRHAHHMLEWSRPATRRSGQSQTGHAALAALAARSFSAALSHEITSRKARPSPQHITRWLDALEQMDPTGDPTETAEATGPLPQAAEELIRMLKKHAAPLNWNSMSAH